MANAWPDYNIWQVAETARFSHGVLFQVSCHGEMDAQDLDILACTHASHDTCPGSRRTQRTDVTAKTDPRQSPTTAELSNHDKELRKQSGTRILQEKPKLEI
jgi:hypothetical protein